MTLALIDDLLSETDVLKRWPALSRCLLRAARHSGRIAWVKGKRGSAWYRPTAIEEFITKELEQPCHDHAPDRSSSLMGNGLRTIQDPKTSTGSGLSSELEERVALASAQKILTKRS